MPSAFSHALVGFTLAKVLAPKKAPKDLPLWSALLSAAPDLDVISFKFGIERGSPWAHRGLTHSILFALILALLFTYLRYRNEINTRVKIAGILFLSIASHGFLDAFTSGGSGVGFFIPAYDGRYFFPWTPIAVSPIGVGRFFSTRGLHVLASECLWIGIPCFIILGVVGCCSRKQLTATKV